MTGSSLMLILQGWKLKGNFVLWDPLVGTMSTGVFLWCWISKFGSECTTNPLPVVLTWFTGCATVRQGMKEAERLLTSRMLEDESGCVSRAKMGNVCDHDRGASVVCDDEFVGMVAYGAIYKNCNNRIDMPFVVLKLHTFSGWTRTLVLNLWPVKERYWQTVIPYWCKLNYSLILSSSIIWGPTNILGDTTTEDHRGPLKGVESETQVKNESFLVN